ncbi:MAG: WXG100 family type VII secretion target [Actinomycetes bacterium]
MPGTYPPALMHVEPSAIPAVRTAVEDALVDVGAQVQKLRRDAPIRAPWLGDTTSQVVQAHYQARVVDAPDGPLAAMVAYQDELTRIRDNLQLIEDHYRRTEGDNTARWGRGAADPR